LTDLLKRLSDPGSPDFRRWLSVADFTEQFGRTQLEYQKAVDFARGNGRCHYLPRAAHGAAVLEIPYWLAVLAAHVQRLRTTADR
jgi:hypothetical protein